MSLTQITKSAALLVGSLSLSFFLANAQTGNTGGSSGGTGGGQHGEGSGPSGSSISTGGAYFDGDPDKNPYASPTPTAITGGGKAEPSGTPKHRKSKSGGHHDENSASPSPSH